jgi:hypothetical protein
MSLISCAGQLPAEFRGVLKHNNPDSVFKEKLLQQEQKLLQFFQALLKTHWSENVQLKGLAKACVKAISKKHLSSAREKTKAKLIKLFNETVQKQHHLEVKVRRPQPVVKSRYEQNKALEHQKFIERECEKLKARNQRLDIDLITFMKAYQKNQAKVVQLRHELEAKNAEILELQAQIVTLAKKRKVRFAEQNQTIPITANNQGVHVPNRNQPENTNS